MLYLFLIDLLLAGILLGALLSFNGFLNARAESLTGGKSVEEFKSGLLTASENQAKEVLSQVKILALSLFLGGAILLIFSLLLFSYSTKLSWEILLNKFNWKKYWRWNGLTIVLTLFALLWALIYLGVFFLTRVVFSADSFLVMWFLRFLGLIFLLLFLLLAFLVNYSFVHKYRVWEALGEGFHLLKKFFYWPLLLITVTSILISILTFLLGKLTSQEWVYNIISGVLFLILLAWMRIYVVKVIGEHHG
jgi:hypothetical protein